MSRHSFDPDVAKFVGVNAAVIFKNISWWCERNAIKERNVHDGNAWTFNSISNLEKLFTYLTAKQIRTALEKLESSGLLVTGNFNKDNRDRTKWYALAESTEAFARMVSPHLPKRAETFAQKGKPLPDNKPDNKHTPIPPEGDLFQPEEVAEKDQPKEPDRFSEFYNVYPKKVGKGAAQKAWDKALKSATPDQIINGAKNYAAWMKCEVPRGEFRPHAANPATWLNQERWTDVLPDYAPQTQRSHADVLRERYANYGGSL